MSPSPAEPLIDQVARICPAAVELAELLAPCVRAEGALVRRLRLELLPHLSAEAEAELWFSPLVQAHSAAGLSLSVPVAVALRRRLTGQWQTGRRPALERAQAIYAEVHDYLPPPLRLEEEVAWLLIAGDVDGVSAQLARARAAIVAEPERFRFWAAQATARIPDGIRLAGDGILAEDGFRGGVWETAYRTLGTKPMAVRHTGQEIEFGGPAGPGSRKVGVPDSDAVPLELRWSSAGAPATERIVVDLREGASPIIVQIAGHVEVQTAAGAVYLVRDDPFERPVVVDPAADPAGELRSMLVSRQLPGLRLAESDEAAEIGVELRGGQVTLVDAAGEAFPAVPRLNPRLERLAAGTAALASHVSRWLTATELRSGSPLLADAIRVTATPAGIERGLEVEQGQDIDVSPGSPAVVALWNLHSEPLSAAILALSSDWSVRVLAAAAGSRVLNPGDPLSAEVSLKALAPGQAEGFIRVIGVAARHPFDPQRLSLPPIIQAGSYQPVPAAPPADAPSLDTELAFMTGARRATALPRYTKWVTRELVVHVRPPVAEPVAPVATPLEVIEREPEEAAASAEPAAAPDARRKPEPSASRPARKLLHIGMLGAPGSGKTTFLAALYIAVNRSDQEINIFGADERSTDFLVNSTRTLTSERQFPVATIAPSSYSWAMNMTTQVEEYERAFLVGRRKITRSVPVQLNLDFIDTPGEFYDSRSKLSPGGAVPEEALDRIAGCEGLMLFIDPLREREVGGTYEYVNRILLGVAQRRMASITPGTRLPHHVAVCITKFDDPEVYRFARVNGYRTYDENDPYLFPRVHNEDAKSFFLDFCRDSATEDADLVSKSLDRYFYSARIRYFVTSAIGFHTDQSSRFREDDPGNAAEIDGSLRIRGRIRPINVLEPVLWLGQNITT